MERTIEWYLAITTIVFAISHILRSADWAEAYCRLHAAGRSGAFINGWLSILPGAAVIAGHGSWDWPGAVLTAFGWLMVIKGLLCLTAPEWALRSMARAGSSPRGFVFAGVVLGAVGAWACYCLVLGNDAIGDIKQLQ